MILTAETIKWESVYGDPIEFDFPITPDAESTVTTFVGGSAQVAFVNGETRIAGTGTIVSALKGHGSFAVNAVPVGEWELQIRATPPAGQAQTMRRLKWTVLKSAFTA